MTFREAIHVVLQHEGGYVCDPRDPGGETNFGISKRSYPDIDIARLTRDQAIEIYKRDFWLKINGPSLPDPLKLVVLDFAINAGVRRAAYTLQKIVGTNADGKIGPKTLKAVSKYSPYTLLWNYTLKRLEFYQKLPGWKHYSKGWTKRILDVTKHSAVNSGYHKA